MPPTSKESPFPSPEFGELLLELTKAGANIAVLKGISQQELDAGYSLGYSHYAAGDYLNAFRVFRFLVAYDHFQDRFWRGLAGCQQMLGDHDNASTSFLIAAVLSGGDENALLYAANNRLATGDKRSAVDILRVLVLSATDDPAHDEARARAEALIELLEAQLRVELSAATDGQAQQGPQP